MSHGTLSPPFFVALATMARYSYLLKYAQDVFCIHIVLFIMIYANMTCKFYTLAFVLVSYWYL